LVTVRPPKPPKPARGGSAAPAPQGELRLVNHQARRRSRLRRKRLWAILLPLAAVGALVAIAPPLPQGQGPSATLPRSEQPDPSGEDSRPFRYAPDAEAFSLDIDPRAVQFDLLEGWDREQDAFADSKALAFVSGPMYERYGAEGSASTVPLGDLKFGGRILRGPNRSAARQRAFLGIRYDGKVVFGYGELTPDREKDYDTFIGGLHSIYNDQEPEPADYKGAYSISMGQQIRYFLPRIRVIYGLRRDGRLAILMSRDGLTLEQTKAMARDRGFVAAYMPDHASKSRFIIPGVKGFSSEDANWISGGATSFVHVPYMLRLSRRSLPLPGVLLASLETRLPLNDCGNPLQCGQGLASNVADRALAGFNRLMEQGVVPLARLIWAPLGPQRSPGRPAQQAPLREPVITADPQPVQASQRRDLAIRQDNGPLEPPAPGLPPPRGLPSNPDAPAARSVEEEANPSAPKLPRQHSQEGASPTAGSAPQPDPARSTAAPSPGSALTTPPAAADSGRAREPEPPPHHAAAPLPGRTPPPVPPAASATLPVAPPPPLSPPPPLP